MQPEKFISLGLGPGDPALITLRAVECLRAAEVVLYDYLANASILDHARADAELICLGRHGQGKLWSQREIDERLVSLANSGKVVARLKGGDPAIFARTAQEVDALTAASVPFEIVPGITAALAVSSYTGISLTDRDAASAVAFVAGQETGEKPTDAIDYGSLAGFPGTLVVYMGVTTAQAWSEQLIAAGKPVDTPAAIIRRCSWPNQESIRCTLGTVAAEIQAKRIRPPAVIVIGEVTRDMPESSWFTDRPLFGRRVLLTRPEKQVAALRRRLAELGADVLVQPAIEISEPEDWAPVDAALAELASYDWLVFSSSNGVRFLVDRLIDQHGDVRSLAGVQIAAIGPGTAEALAEYRVKADLVPEEYRAEALAEALTAEGSATGKRFLLARASRGREVLAETLRAAGAEVEQVVVYRSADADALAADVVTALDEGSIDWVTITSSAIARSMAALLGSRLEDVRLASISPITSDTLRELGFEPAAEATVYTMDGLVDAILHAESGTSKG